MDRTLPEFTQINFSSKYNNNMNATSSDSPLIKPMGLGASPQSKAKNTVQNSKASARLASQEVGNSNNSNNNVNAADKMQA